MDRAHALEVLGLPGEVPDPEAIKARYRQLAKIVHPDVGGSAWLFRQVEEAYRVLSGVGATPAPSSGRRFTKEDAFRSPDFAIPFRLFYTLMEHRHKEFNISFKGKCKFRLDIHDIGFYNPAVTFSVEVKAEQVLGNNVYTKEVTFKSPLMGTVDMPAVTLYLPFGIYRVQLRFANNLETRFLPKPCTILVPPKKEKTVEMQADLSTVFEESKINFHFACQTRADKKLTDFLSRQGRVAAYSATRPFFCL